jgi:hypothetical protein
VILYLFFLDVNDIKCVINYDFPNTTESKFISYSDMKSPEIINYALFQITCIASEEQAVKIRTYVYF